jgi:response regulator of citrate/malate metabolism
MTSHLFESQVTEPTEHVNSEFNQYLDYYMQLLRVGSRGRILIVEDDFIAGRFLEKSVTEFSPHIKCFTATSMDEALKLCERIQFDVIISDYFLKGEGTGLDLCQEIQSKFPKVQCLIISRLKFYQYQEMSKYAKAPPDFVEKPIKDNTIRSYLSLVYGGGYVA